LLEDEEVEMPDFNEGDNRNELGEVVADSDDEDNVSEDEVLSEVYIQCFFVTMCLFRYFPFVWLLLSDFIFYVWSK
jgi:hypothetical protein